MSQGDKDHAKVFPIPPLLYVVPLIAGIGLHMAIPVRILPIGWLQFATGLPVMGIALIILVTAVREMRRAGTAIDPGDATIAIVTGGPFRFSRNPLYLTLATAYVGIALSVNALWPLAFLPISLIMITVWVISGEEKYLEGKFGEEYLLYKRRVRRWL